MFFSKQKSFLGVDLGAGGAKIVELKEEKKRPVLHTYGFTTAAQNIHQLFAPKEKNVSDLLQNKEKSLNTMHKEDAVASSQESFRDAQINKYVEILKSVCSAARISTKIAVVSLPVSSVFHAVVTLPMVDKKEFSSILNAEVKKLLPRPIDEMAIDYQVLPAIGKGEEEKGAGRQATKSQKILVNAVPKDLVLFYSKIFQRAGLVLDALEPESVALQRSLVGRDKSVTLIIDIGAERTNFFIVDQTVPVTHHSIETGGEKMNRIMQNILGIEEDLVEDLKQDLSKYLSERTAFSGDANRLLDNFMPAIDPIIKEIQYSFDLFLRQSGNENKKPEKIILTGGTAALPGLANFISEKFKVKCYVGDPWARVVYQDGLKPVLNKIGPRMSVAIGLALRNLV